MRMSLNKRSSTGFRSLLCVFSMALCVLAAGQQHAKRTLIRPGKLLDVKTGRVLGGQVIVVDGDRIAGVGPEIKPSLGTS